MPSRGSGANTEPLPFIRKFGTPDPDDIKRNVDSLSKSPAEKRSRDKESRGEKSSKDKSRKDRERDKDKERSKERRRRSRSRDDDRERKRHRSRSPHSRRRSRRDSDDHKSRRDSSRDKSSRYDETDSRESESRTIYEVAAPKPDYFNDQTQVLAVPPPPPPQYSNGDNNNGEIIPPENVVDPREARRRSRWSTTKAFVPGMPTILPADMDETQRQVYLLQIEVEESTRKLRMNEFTTPAEERSPSPEPIYDNMGKRLNTREVRKRQELEQRRHEKIQTLMRLKPEYKPPADYRPPNIRLHEKVWIPQDEHPEINFVGLLIGPRGNTLKSLELETGARIIIRGKGSVKEGKLLRRDGPMPGENEPLHAYVTGTDPVVIKAACEKIKSILDDALNRPDANNMLRQHQLRELAVLNGTLRAEDALGGTRCSNCGSDQHKTYECPEAPNMTANIICTSCGGAGHIAKDCLAPRTGYQASHNEELDNEYAALLAEIDGGSSKPKQVNTTNNAATNNLLPFRLPPQQGHPHRPQAPRQYQQNQQGGASAGFYPPPPPPPPGHLMPPPGWTMPDNLDPAAAAAAAAAMAASNGGFSSYSLLPPPPPPPQQFGEGI
jgi:splicing factor 1|uniref:Branchpoint-bridging protein n=1 Tax=Panagrolaimus sp. PS1159 TaxID=55785 RepID=A0AC35GQH7_9BILA